MNSFYICFKFVCFEFILNSFSILLRSLILDSSKFFIKTLFFLQYDELIKYLISEIKRLRIYIFFRETVSVYVSLFYLCIVNVSNNIQFCRFVAAKGSWNHLISVISTSTHSILRLIVHEIDQTSKWRFFSQ